jgi:hypothetical protein
MSFDVWGELEDAGLVPDDEKSTPPPAPYAAKQAVVRWLRICSEAREAMQSVGATGDVEAFVRKAITYYAAHLRAQMKRKPEGSCAA